VKTILVVTIGLLLLQTKDSLVNSVWAYKIADRCNNTLTFKPNGVVLEYNCELNYAFHSTYKLVNDTITIKGKDDSHSEDGGKILSHWITTYLIKGNTLVVIASKELVRDKWTDRKIKSHVTPDYIKIK
jgi:hypothetical protein